MPAGGPSWTRPTGFTGSVRALQQTRLRLKDTAEVNRPIVHSCFMEDLIRGYSGFYRPSLRSRCPPTPLFILMKIPTSSIAALSCAEISLFHKPVTSISPTAYANTSPVHNSVIPVVQFHSVFPNGHQDTFSCDYFLSRECTCTRGEMQSIRSKLNKQRQEIKGNCIMSKHMVVMGNAHRLVFDKHRTR